MIVFLSGLLCGAVVGGIVGGWAVVVFMADNWGRLNEEVRKRQR